MSKNIFFHADDFGRSKLISKNIIRCIKFGHVNSISVMMNFDDTFFKNLTKLKKLKKIKLHLNLTEKTKKTLLSSCLILGIGLLSILSNHKKQLKRFQKN